MLRGLVHFLSAVAMLFLLGSALLIGLILEIIAHPMYWLGVFWFPLMMFAASIVAFIFRSSIDHKRG